jgi:pyrroline-5-carboxylate reductase
MISIEKIGFIGGGNMGEALIKGLIKGAFPAADILVAEPAEGRRLQLVECYGIDARADAAEVVAASEVVVLAIKPQIVPLVMSAIAKALDQSKLLISIAAGVTSQTLEGYLSDSPRVIRVMPNTPALVGAGATAICRGSHASEDDLLLARHLFEAVGIVQVVSEGQMDAVTGVSGSGPAYIYTVIEAMAAGGVQQGLTMDVALALAAQTVFGAAKLVMESGEHPALLRDKVCSPGGTTIAAVKVLEEKGLRAALMEAVAQAARRSAELGKK